ncbi:MAG: hypothetical protein K6B46_02675 [Opitutales bacterium]|nr:hypothetical protein [Opitutales bacterium]
MEELADKTPFRRWVLYWIPSFVCSYFWVVGMAFLGNASSFLGLSIFGVGVLVVLPALLQPPTRGLGNVVLSGFLVDAYMPRDYTALGPLSMFEKTETIEIFGSMPAESPEFFGFITGWLVVAFIVLRFFRRFLPVTTFRCWMIVAEIVNTVLFFIWTLAFGWDHILSFDYWRGGLLTLIASSLAIFVFGWLYFDALIGAYRLCGIDLIKQREVLEDE